MTHKAEILLSDALRHLTKMRFVEAGACLRNAATEAWKSSEVRCAVYGAATTLAVALTGMLGLSAKLAMDDNKRESYFLYSACETRGGKTCTAEEKESYAPIKREVELASIFLTVASLGAGFSVATINYRRNKKAENRPAA